MLISENRIRNLVRKALLEAASEEEIAQRVAKIKADNPNLSDAGAQAAARAELEAQAGDQADSDEDTPVPAKGFGEWGPEGGAAFRQWMHADPERKSSSSINEARPGEYQE